MFAVTAGPEYARKRQEHFGRLSNVLTMRGPTAWMDDWSELLTWIKSRGLPKLIIRCARRAWEHGKVLFSSIFRRMRPRWKQFSLLWPENSPIGICPDSSRRNESRMMCEPTGN